MSCKHMNFSADVVVSRLEDSGRFAADVKISCTDCRMPFKFLGLPAGVDLNGAAVSVGGTEARLTIAPSDGAMSFLEGAPQGFTIRRSHP